MVAIQSPDGRGIVWGEGMTGLAFISCLLLGLGAGLEFKKLIVGVLVFIVLYLLFGILIAVSK